jgi:hypothetical protein
MYQHGEAGGAKWQTSFSAHSGQLHQPAGYSLACTGYAVIIINTMFHAIGIDTLVVSDIVGTIYLNLYKCVRPFSHHDKSNAERLNTTI